MTTPPRLDHYSEYVRSTFAMVSLSKNSPVEHLERDYDVSMELYIEEFTQNPRARASHALSGNVVRPMFQVLCPNLGPLVEPKHASRQRYDLGPMSVELENRWIKGGECFGLEAGD